MKPNVKREMTSGGIADSASFGLSEEDSSHLMTILRDTMYSDRILAVLREYSANAWDEHRLMGKPDLPIKVILPTAIEPKLVIRDYGPGLSREDVFNVYTKYGKSTKRDSDNAVGMLGIGSKSGFAYADSFSVTSWHGGKKSLYVAVLDKSNKGTMNLLHEEKCKPGETGIEIQIAIEQKDIQEFHDRAKFLFKHFVPRPEINLELPVLPSEKYDLKSGFLYVDENIDPDNEGWTAVMGCVPYRIDLNKIRDVKPGIGENAYNLSGVLYFDIGEVQINASREELKYSDDTKKSIVNKINSLTDEFVTYVLKSLETSTPWEELLGAEVLRRLNFLVKKALLIDRVDLSDDKKKAPKSFFLSNQESTKRVGFIHVHESTRLLIHDSPRAIAGYELTRFDRIVRHCSSVKIDEKELNSVVKQLGIHGIPILRLSDMPWESTRVYSSSGGIYNQKHTKNLFQLKQMPAFQIPWSQDWEVVEHTPTSEDVFTILYRFCSYDLFSSHRSTDKDVCEFFKLDFPTIYGYKSTDNKPVSAKDCEGKSYEEWRKTLYEGLVITSKNKKLLELYSWALAAEDTHYYHHRPGRQKRYKQLPKLLADGHGLIKWLHNRDKFEKDWKKLPLKTRNAIKVLAEMSDDTTESDRQYQSLKETYPLLFRKQGGGLEDLWNEEDDASLWIEYVQLIDRVNANATSEKNHDKERHPVHPDQRVDQRRVEGEDPHGSEERAELQAAP